MKRRTVLSKEQALSLPYATLRFAQLGWRAQFSNLARHADKLFARQSFIDTMPS